VVNKSRASSVEQGAKSGVLVVGTEGLMTQLARCCKPAPPDPIVGFVTRGKGVSIHRASCKNFAEMAAKAPERVIETDWGPAGKDTVYPVDIFILAGDRQGLLRDISEMLTAREDQRDRREHPEHARGRRAWASPRRSVRPRNCRRR
jgi:GTP pyrophosphokinase